MSDVDVVNNFVGDYKHLDDNETVNNHPEKAPYYPPEGVHRGSKSAP